jgi:hypothetical protein
MTQLQQNSVKGLLVRVWGMDSEGKLFDANLHTMEITDLGARLVGVVSSLRRGAIIGVECGQGRAAFRVAWIGQKGTPQEGQIGIRCLEQNKDIWGISRPSRYWKQ